MRHPTALLLALPSACATGAARPAQPARPAPAIPPPATPETSSGERPQYPSSYQRHPNPPVLIRNATILTATGREIANGSIAFKDGRIVAVGTQVETPAGAVVVDGTGKFVTPGVIDDDSQLGV